ncbi:tyrosine kinase receptor Cad96Ca [Stomoxys calcitrans]|uniref:receptor protein-tyrosine kinase n=1 Tax=Stomoxys calcitrans TaxID=35570 RepID=A0A1I8NN73_STOCA|nr:tyrosine kinase receptor Cad96Ca [Stomoxys calcitrans]XP_013109291.1 tyrosine kinase receptor Cad96Ca [Stomoxys calcitrans]XP_013109292.1 tyrosine kinase receptor Cad96Ca [Stomoxys calcitrans]
MKRTQISGFAVTAIQLFILIINVKSSSCQDDFRLNSPPILVVPDRNWRIMENEPIGQIITRIRADDSENDELVFGLESQYNSTKIPFRIDPIGGVVYLSDSLVGRGGEKFFLYVTVTDGQLTAKNEVYVNILSANDRKNRISKPPPPTSHVVQNISEFLPSFHSLPGVQSIRNHVPNSRPNLPAGFNENNFSPTSVYNYPNQKIPEWFLNGNAKYDVDNEDNLGNRNETNTSITSPTISKSTGRTKLTVIVPHNSTILPTSPNATPGVHTSVESSDSSVVLTNSGGNKEPYDYRSQIVLSIFVSCGLFIAFGIAMAVMYRKRLCAFAKASTKKSKEEMAKTSNQSNFSTSSTTVDSRNSMVLNQWNGPIAYGNRYVPWERGDLSQQDQQQQHEAQPIATSQLSTSMGSIRATSSGSAGVAGVNAVTISNNQKSKIDHWEYPRHRLKFFNILGEGAFGQVWRCEAIDINGHEGNTTVAVKTLKENATEVEKKDLFSELEVMKSLEPHVNVVRFLGCCTDKDPIFVIIEYVNRGKLQSYLRSSRAERHYGNTHGKSNILTSADLTSFMYQIAKGMDYLSSRGIIHRDLAARNILITDNHTCKVADFGFARDVITSKIYERKSEGKLPIRWMAIESLYDNLFSVKSDIWSFGILMWEIVTLGSTPYPGISASEVMRKVRDGYRLEKPEHCRRELYNIMYYCWSQDPSDRPLFAELVQMLDKLLHTEMDYIELERFPDHNYYNIINLSCEKV